MHMWELFTRVFSRTLHSPWVKGRTSGLAQFQFQPYYKLQSRDFYVFENFDLLSQAPMVWCLTHLHIASILWDISKQCWSRSDATWPRWRRISFSAVEIWIKTPPKTTPKVVMSSSKRLKLGNSIRHVVWKRVLFRTQFYETLHVPFLLWIQYDLSILYSNDNSLSLFRDL